MRIEDFSCLDLFGVAESPLIIAEMKTPTS